MWPTWADILGKQFDEYQNWGVSGGGNALILNSLIECHIKNKITKHDTVGIMWTNVAREDRYINGKWQAVGNLFNPTQNFYDHNFIKNYVDLRGCYLRDLSAIQSVKMILDSVGCKYFFLSMIPIGKYDDVVKNNQYSSQSIDDLLYAYRDTLQSIKLSVFETIFNNDWFSRPYCNSLDNVRLEPIRQSWKANAGSAWPSFEDFVNNNISVPNNILKEIFDTKRWNWSKDILDATQRTDFHPTPAEALEYLDQVLPEYTISSDVRNWCQQINKLVVDRNWPNESINWNPATVERW